MGQNTERVNEVFQEEKLLPENSGKAQIALSTEIAKRLLSEANDQEQKAVVEMISRDFKLKCAAQTHLNEAAFSDPLVQEK